ncbi:MAG: hypothetical protein EpisKO_04140 [Epibacterium sp.]
MGAASAEKTVLNTVFGIAVLATANPTQRLPHSKFNTVTELTSGTHKLGAVFKHTKSKPRDMSIADIRFLSSERPV